MDGTAAACSIVWAKGRDPLGARLQDFDETAARAVDFGEDGFAGKGIRHEDEAVGPVRDTFAALAETFDFETRCEIDHGRRAPTRYSWLPSPPSIGEAISPATCQPESCR